MPYGQKKRRHAARLLGGLCAFGVLALAFFLKGGAFPKAAERLSSPALEMEKPLEIDKKMISVHAFLADAPAFWRESQPAESCPIRKPLPLVLLPHYVPLHTRIQGALATWKACSGNPEILRVIVIGPDHHHRLTAGSATFMGAGYETPLGKVLVDQDVRSALTGGGAVPADTLFLAEHSVGTFPVFVKQTFPRATFTPLVVSARATQAELTPIIEALRPFLADPQTLVILSADFTHYLSRPVADRNDREIERALVEREDDFLWSARDSHTDFGRGLWLASRLAGVAPFRVLGKVNSAEIGGSAANTTSFFFGWWER